MMKRMGIEAVYRRPRAAKPAPGPKNLRVRMRGWRRGQDAGCGCEVAACQDRRAHAGKRFFRMGGQQGGVSERKAMIDREHDLPITKQVKVLRISRGSVYYLPRPVSPSDLEVMRRLDRLHLEDPFARLRRV